MYQSYYDWLIAKIQSEHPDDRKSDAEERINWMSNQELTKYLSDYLEQEF